MHTRVWELLGMAAYWGITRREIAAKAGIAETTFTKWKTRYPRLSTLEKAEQALEDLIRERGLLSEKVES